MTTHFHGATWAPNKPAPIPTIPPAPDGNWIREEISKEPMMPYHSRDGDIVDVRLPPDCPRFPDPELEPRDRVTPVVIRVLTLALIAVVVTIVLVLTDLVTL